MKKARKETLQGWGILAGAAVVFIILKLTGITSWGWVWVLSPLWLPFAFALVAVVVLVPMISIRALRDTTKEERDNGT